MRCALLIAMLMTGCGWKPKPYLRDPMNAAYMAPGAAAVEPLKPVWPAPPIPTHDSTD